MFNCLKIFGRLVVKMLCNGGLFGFVDGLDIKVIFVFSILVVGLWLIRVLILYLV